MPMSPASTSRCRPTTVPRSSSAAPSLSMTVLPWRTPRWRARCRSSTSRPRPRPRQRGRASWRRRCRIASEVTPSRWRRRSTAAAWPALPPSRSTSAPIRATPWCWLRARACSASSASRGARGGRPSCWRCSRPLAGAYGEDWWFTSAHAFAQVEAGDIDRALATIERSLALNPRNANGSHIRAHVYYESGERAAGLAYLEEWWRDYPKESLLHCHLSWHIALWRMELGRAHDAWEFYRAHLRPGASTGPPLNTLTDSASFLFRAEMAGEKRDPELWRELSHYATQWFPSPGIAFADVHGALAHALAGNADALARIVDGAKGPAAGDRGPDLARLPRLRPLGLDRRDYRAGDRHGRTRARRRQPGSARPHRVCACRISAAGRTHRGGPPAAADAAPGRPNERLADPGHLSDRSTWPIGTRLGRTWSIAAPVLPFAASQARAAAADSRSSATLG